MKIYAADGAKARDISCIAGDLRLNQNDVQEFSSSRFIAELRPCSPML